MSVPTVVCEDDILCSIIDFIKTGKSVTVKDVTGTADFLSGALSTVFPDLSVEMRASKDMEKPAFPRLILSKGAPFQGMAYYGGTEKRWPLAIAVNSTWIDEETNVVDYDLSALWIYQLDTALGQLFDGNMAIPLKSYTYDGSEPVLIGELDATAWSGFIEEDGISLYGTVKIGGVLFPS